MRTKGLLFLQAHSIWPNPRAFDPAQNSIGTPKYRGAKLNMERKLFSNKSNDLKKKKMCHYP